MPDRWPTTRAEGVPCFACGKAGNCTISPDRKRCKCWKKDGGLFNADGSEHVPGERKAGRSILTSRGEDGSSLFASDGTARITLVPAARPAIQRRSSRAYETAREAIKAAGQNISGEHARTWDYKNANGKRVAKVARWDLEDGGKEYRPVHPAADGWHVGDPPGLWPLYKLDELPREGTIFIAEGEKAADAANALGLSATTSAHGASAAAKTDWSPLAGREVVLLPDHDQPGLKYARDVAGILCRLEPPARVKVVALPGLPDGGDVVEFIAARPKENPATIASSIIAIAKASPTIDPADVNGGPVVTCMADVEAQQVSWLWAGRIPMGRITLLVGKPGEGKSFLMLDLAGRLSRGLSWPDGMPCKKGHVLLITAEDGAADTIRPRLDACGADVRRVHLLSAVRRIGADGKPRELMFSLSDVDALEAALKRLPECRLVVIDPIGSFLGGAVDAHRDNEVRGVLAPIARLAAKYGPAVVIVAHRRKGGGDAADDLALGSRAFTGIARATWHLSRDPADKSRRLLLAGKNNLAPEGTGLAFSISGEPPRLQWEDAPVELSADEGVAAEKCGEPGRPSNERDEAAAWLLDELKDHKDHPVKDLRDAATAVGLAWRTLQTASNVLRVVRRREGFGKGGTWCLPAGHDEPAIRAESPRGSNFGANGANDKSSQKGGNSCGADDHSRRNSLPSANGNGHPDLSREELHFRRAQIQAVRENKPWFRRMRDRNGWDV